MLEMLLHEPESKTLEFKRDLSSPKNFLKTLVAFANTTGGRLIFGVADNSRQVIGIENPLDEEERLCNQIADAISPRLVPNVELITVDNKTLLVVEVYLSGTRPHWLKTDGPDSGVYVRLGSSNRQADRELIAELRRGVEGVAFDEMPMPDLSINDLDLKVVEEMFKGRRVLDEKALVTLKLLRQEQGKLVPTKGAMLLFGKERIYHFPDAWVQCGRFIGHDKTNIFDHIEIEDPLPRAVESIMLFLKKHAMRGADFSEIRRKDVWSIPLVILREAVINALVHSDYSQRGAPVRIAFFDDRIEIENPGILLPGMTIEDMKQGVSKIRNTVISRVFRELELIEQWGSGIRRMFNEAQALSLPPPEIIEIGMHVRVVVRLAKSIPIAKTPSFVAELTGPGIASGIESGAELGVESEMALQILACLREARLSKSEIARQQGRAKPNRYLNELMRRLLQAGYVEYTIPDKPNSRLQKYRLTKGGMIFLQNQTRSIK